MEEYISAGRVTVDGKVATLGDRINANQQVRVDGHPVKIAAEAGTGMPCYCLPQT